MLELCSRQAIMFPKFNELQFAAFCECVAGHLHPAVTFLISKENSLFSPV
jgi:hypothetical protein